MKVEVSPVSGSVKPSRRTCRMRPSMRPRGGHRVPKPSSRNETRIIAWLGFEFGLGFGFGLGGAGFGFGFGFGVRVRVRVRVWVRVKG